MENQRRGGHKKAGHPLKEDSHPKTISQILTSLLQKGLSIYLIFNSIFGPKIVRNQQTTMAKYWETHPDSIWLYDPNLPLAIVATVLYAIPLLIQFWQSVFKYKSYYFIVVFLGALLEVGGYAVRTASIKDESSIVIPPSLD